MASTGKKNRLQIFTNTAKKAEMKSQDAGALLLYNRELDKNGRGFTSGLFWMFTNERSLDIGQIIQRETTLNEPPNTPFWKCLFHKYHSQYILYEQMHSWWSSYISCWDNLMETSFIVHDTHTHTHNQKVEQLLQAKKNAKKKKKIKEFFLHSCSSPYNLCKIFYKHIIWLQKQTLLI